MSTLPVLQILEFSCSSRHRIHRNFPSRRRGVVSVTININHSPSMQQKRDEYFPTLQPGKTHRFRTVMKADYGLNQPTTEFLPDECHGMKNIMEFTVQEAFLDEEFWSSAWLKAESFLEEKTNRYANSYKKKFAEQEFYALKRRVSPHYTPRCFCVIAYHSNNQVKKEEKDVELTTLESIVGTLDLSVHQLQGETFPGEPREPFSFFSFNSPTRPQRYGHLANLCVAKSARRQGIATKMLHFAIETAKSQGLEKIFVYVDRENKPAWELYQTMGFQVVECPALDLEEGQLSLLLFTV